MRKITNEVLRNIREAQEEFPTKQTEEKEGLCAAAGS